MIRADLFVISTAVEKSSHHYNKPDQKWIDRMTVSEANATWTRDSSPGQHAAEDQAILKFMEKGGRKRSSPIRRTSAARCVEKPGPGWCRDSVSTGEFCSQAKLSCFTNQRLPTGKRRVCF